jgi:hypothetical protein
MNEGYVMTAIFFQQPSGLDDAYRLQLVSSILQSNHFGPSALGREFVNTSGFSVVFKRERLETVVSNFPFFAELLEAALFDDSNAFYVNPLVLDENSIVEEHVDCRYIPESGTRILHTLISLYYAEIDEHMEGGDLVFVTEGRDVTVKPKRNDIVHFVGSARHYVSKIVNPCRRVSVVIEQYNLDGDSLRAFPECHLVQNDTSAKFPTRN